MHVMRHNFPGWCFQPNHSFEIILMVIVVFIACSVNHVHMCAMANTHTHTHFPQWESIFNVTDDGTDTAAKKKYNTFCVVYGIHHREHIHVKMDDSINHCHHCLLLKNRIILSDVDELFFVRSRQLIIVPEQLNECIQFYLLLFLFSPTDFMYVIVF